LSAPAEAVANLVVRAPQVLSAVDLENQSSLKAGKVDDVSADRHLSPKVHAEEVTPEIPPEPMLGIGHAPAQFAGSGGGVHPEGVSLLSRKAKVSPHGIEFGNVVGARAEPYANLERWAPS
jgi:hypothetical protein